MNRVYLFTTCIGGAVMGETMKSAIKLLRREGFEVVFKKDQTCCGQPSYNSGYFEESKNVARYTAKLFSEDYPVLVPSGSCTAMMTEEYAQLFEGDKDEQLIKDFSAKVMELGIFLDKKLNVTYEDRGDPVKVTWHSNCHALRYAKTIESSKNLIRRFKNVELIDLPYEEECCGFGGTFCIHEPEVSNAMASEKVHNVLSTGASYIIAGDAPCLLNIGGTLSRLGNKTVKPVHLYDFLIERLEGKREAV